jgi:hypothetical protein
MKRHITTLFKVTSFHSFFAWKLSVERSALSVLSLLLSAAGLVPALRAETVALWKLDYEANGSALNARCLLDPTNDLGLNGTGWNGTAVDGWATLPPNPDTTGGLLASPTNMNAVGLTANSTPPNTSLTNCAVSARVNVTSSFTVEGWVFRVNNPAGTFWHYLVGNHLGGPGRWILSLRNGGTNWILYVDSQIGDKPFPVQNDPASTNVWRHIALTYNRDAGSAQQGVWELFVNSQSHGTLTNSSRPSTISPSDSVFSLGGRPNSNNAGNAKLDYWRVSDTVLSTNDFLNAGAVQPVTESLPRTIAYWRLDGAADGPMETGDFVGSARLSGNLDLTNHTSTIRPATLQAFEGQPPNSAPALPDGNAGSVYAQASGACLQTPNLGAQLEVTNSFTVEGWLNPQRRDYSSDLQYIANTRINTKGWAFALKKQGDATWKFVIYAEDDAGTLAGDAPLSGDLSAWSDAWRHVALVYDASAGTLTQGVWSCYLNGVLQGSVTNAHAVSGNSASSYFHLSGRVSTGSTFCGYLDCWRVCKAALTPSQFLNATAGASPATDVLALWPLESSDGVYLDVGDRVGAYSFNTPVAATYKVTASAGQAAVPVPNPDASAAFKGDPALNAGSVVFNTPANTAPRAYLSTTDAAIKETLCLTNSFTWEGWFYRTLNPGGWQILFASGSAPNYASGGMNINLTYRTNGYVLFVGGSAGISDVAFGGTTDDKTLNVWRHLALVYDVSVGNGIWSLYIDGVLQGSLANASVPPRTVPGCVYVGGRPWSANSFYGAIDAVRLTKGVLAPSQFLNAAATPTAPAGPRTVAYWKLDSAAGALDVASQVEPRFSFIPDAYAPAGSAAQFGRFVPVPDATVGFVGDPRANAGSAAFGGTDYLRIQNLGYRAELDRAFTVEGWMLWSNQTATAVQTVAGTRFGSAYGWRLTLDKSGSTAAFRLFCQTPSQTPLAEAAFPYEASPLAGGWHHLALTYTPRRNDTGAWELFVDGASAGTVVNRFYPGVSHQSHWFTLGGQAGGAEAFNGLFDCWRVSEGALTPEQFLYLGYGKGTMILIR